MSQSVAIFVALLTTLNALDVAESNTGALLQFPSVIDGPLQNKTYEVAPAQFGYQAYGGTMKGVLILPANTTYHKECPQCGVNGQSSMCTDEGPEPLGINPYIHYIQDWFIEEDDITDYILVIDRLDCYFVNKIEHAQLMGASGVIMCDWRYENLFTMWMPTDWSDDITIPSVLLSRRNCLELMNHLGVENWDPLNIQNTIYPDPENINWTIAQIEWGLPHDDDRVEWELWTSSNDYLGSKFKHNFNDTAIMLDKANDTQFTPHMYILNGSHWGCPVSGLPCKKQCSNSGRYCAVDPEYDLSLGLDGIDVIQENLRSLCVWEYDKETAQSGYIDDILWWDYAVLWDENCGVYSNSSTNFNEQCSFAQMDKLKTDQSLSQYVQTCITDSGGYGYTDGVNSLLKRETKLKYNSSIYAIPMVRVNEFLIHGNIDCEPPVTASSCEVLAAICAGFIDGTRPHVCELTPSPTVANCSDAYRDCSGVCYGNYVIDACGKCLPISSHEFNECIGCNGQINETYDCAGTCGGHYAVNTCGYCKDTRLPGWNTFGIDCQGNCSTVLKEDECGQCIAESDPTWNQCVGCDNVPNSGFAFNSCGRCIDSTRSDFSTFGQDCSGTCDGDKEIDECGTCRSTSSTDWNNCVGCDGVVDSNKEFNSCGRCIDVNDPNFDEYGKDCRGVCASSVDDTYYFDSCGQCLLPSDEEYDNCCDGDANKQYNPCGLCLFKNLTDFDDRGKDCSGDCEGNLQLDSCGNCILTTSLEWNNCLGCDNEPNSGKTLNPCGLCIDSDRDDFETYGEDCNGECEGNHELDECGQCLMATDEEFNSCLGCDGKPNSNKIYNECGSCVESDDPEFEEYGRDCTGNCAHTATDTHYVDECGQCLLPTDSSWNNCTSSSGGTDGTDTSGSGSGSSDGSGDTNNMNTMMVLIAVIAVILFCVAFIVIGYLCRKNKEMQRNVTEILQNYQPMEDMGDKRNSATVSLATNE